MTLEQYFEKMNVGKKKEELRVNTKGKFEHGRNHFDTGSAMRYSKAVDSDENFYDGFEENKAAEKKQKHYTATSAGLKRNRALEAKKIE